MAWKTKEQGNEWQRKYRLRKKQMKEPRPPKPLGERMVQVYAYVPRKNYLQAQKEVNLLIQKYR